MKQTDTTEPTTRTTTHDATKISWSVIGAALFAAVARLGVVVAAATVLLILLLNEIVAALVYLLAAVLALLFGHCSFAP